MKQIRFSPRELDLVRNNDVCRIATLAEDGWPHCVPVGYLYRNGRFYIPVNRGSKKVRNLRANPRASIVIDDERQKVLMVQGLVEIVEDKLFPKLKSWMTSRTGWTMDTPTSAMLVMKPRKKASWSPSG